MGAKKLKTEKMVSNKTLKEYEFNQIENYFEYIVESKVNGQPQQVESLVKELSKKQKLQFLRYTEQFDNDDDLKYCKNIIHKFM
jgi:hypothetical protein